MNARREAYPEATWERLAAVKNPFVANLRQDNPDFDEVSLEEVRDLNSDVRRIIR
jgi:hypothetical protein